MKVEISSKERKKSLGEKISSALLRWFRLTNEPVVKAYTGFGNKTHCFLYGHVFSLSPLPRKTYRQHVMINALSLLRLFMIKTQPAALLQLTWNGKIYTTRSQKDGFFKFEWQPLMIPVTGIHKVQVDLISDDQQVIASTSTSLVIPHETQFAFISDIDDTFLISYSANLRRRLYVLLTENALSRKPFEGVVNHYQLLANTHAKDEITNPFFYVSSSEWNLYQYIRDFSAKNNIPEGVYLLNQVKRFSQVFKTGQNNHSTKFMRITRVLEAYPEHRFILLGDDSQEDPVIYASVAEHFRHQLFCVYIRQVGNAPKAGVKAKLESIKNLGIHYCYFKHSAEAVIHSRSVGLIEGV